MLVQDCQTTCSNYYQILDFQSTTVVWSGSASWIYIALHNVSFFHKWNTCLTFSGTFVFHKAALLTFVWFPSLLVLVVEFSRTRTWVAWVMANKFVGFVIAIFGQRSFLYVLHVLSEVLAPAMILDQFCCYLIQLCQAKVCSISNSFSFELGIKYFCYRSMLTYMFS